MNSLQIEWDLSIPQQEAISLLSDIIKFPKFRAEVKISEGNFEFLIEHSSFLGTAYREEIEGKGSVITSNHGSHLSVNFGICSPYRYVTLNKKNLIILIPILILSWVGSLFTMIFSDNFVYSNYIMLVLGPLFGISCVILVIGFFKYLTIDDKFKEVKQSFERTFTQYRTD